MFSPFFRQIAFNDVSDLTNVMKDAGFASTSLHQQQNPGAPNDEMYLRQADHEHMTPQLLSICTNLSLRSFEY